MVDGSRRVYRQRVVPAKVISVFVNENEKAAK
jgi:hypothetical protein